MASCSKRELEKLTAEIVEASQNKENKTPSRRKRASDEEEEDLIKTPGGAPKTPVAQKKVLRFNEEELDFDKEEYLQWKHKMLAIAGLL